MAQSYLGEIRMSAAGFAPAGWTFCDGALLPVSGNEALFALLGTTFGGDGTESFALPDLRGRIPLHRGTDPDGNSYAHGASGGVEEVALTVGEIPPHSHAMRASTALAQSAGPGAGVPARTSTVQPYLSDTGQTALGAAAVLPAGGSGAHENLQPYLGIQFILSLFGVSAAETGESATGEPFVAEIRAFACGSAPAGWAPCEGQLLPVPQHPGLFSLLGTTYGGDGESTFALPDLRGRAPLHVGAGQPGPGLRTHSRGEAGGSETVTLSEGEIPAHAHAVMAAADVGDQNGPQGRVLSISNNGPAYAPGSSSPVAMAEDALAPSGGGQPHGNLMPYLALSFCIALEGVFPQPQ